MARKKLSEAEIEWVAVTPPAARDYPGVVARLGPDHRLIVGPDLRRYVVQRRREYAGAEHWRRVGGTRASLARVVERHGDEVPGLAEAVAGLPDDPAEALPEFSEYVAARDEAFAVSDWRREAYGREVARVTNIRLVVAPDASAYAVQMMPASDYSDGARACDDWRMLASFETLTEVVGFLARHAYVPGAPSEVTRGEAVSKALELIHGLPEHVGDGEWPELPARPAWRS